MQVSIYACDAANNGADLGAVASKVNPDTFKLRDVLQVVRERLGLRSPHTGVSTQLRCPNGHKAGALLNKEKYDNGEYGEILNKMLSDLQREGYIAFEEEGEEDGARLSFLVDASEEHKSTAYISGILALDEGEFARTRNTIDGDILTSLYSDKRYSCLDGMCRVIAEAYEARDVQKLEAIKSRLLFQPADEEAVTACAPCTLLIVDFAAANGFVNTLRAIMIELAIRFNFSFTSLLHVACRNGQTETARVLVNELGMDPNVKEIVDNDTPLHEAAKYGHLETVRALVKELRADVNTQNGSRKRPLHLAVANKRKEMVTLLKELGADLDAVDDSGQTALHVAVWFCNTPIVRALCNLGANVDVADDRGHTPLRHINQIYGESVEAIRVLLNAGADVNARNKSGETPLHYFAALGFIDTVRVLVNEFGADLYVRDDKGLAIIHKASECCRVEMVRALVCEFHMDVNIRAENSLMTPLHYAASSSVELVNVLIRELGADEDALDSNGAAAQKGTSQRPLYF